MIGNILRFLLTLLNYVLSHFSAVISVLLSFIFAKRLDLAEYLDIFDDNKLEFNIALYTAIFSKLIDLLKNHINNKKVHIECYFYEHKEDLEKEKILEILEIKTSENSNNLYLDVKYRGNYRELKRYYLEISFPTWVDINEFSKTSLFALNEKRVKEGLNTSSIVVDFMKLYCEDHEYKDASRYTRLHFIINDNEKMGCTEMIEVKIKAKRKLSLYKFNSNKLRILKEL